MMGFNVKVICVKRGFHKPTTQTDERYKLANLYLVHALVGQLISLVFPLYCGHLLVTDRLIEIDIFGQSERFV